MSESRIQGVKVRMTPNKKWDFDYGLGDVQALYRRSEWHNWREAIKWLQEFGEQDNELTPGGRWPWSKTCAASPSARRSS